MTRLVVSCGDPAGIGIRLAAQVLQSDQAATWHVVLTGPKTLWIKWGIKPGINRVLVGSDQTVDIRPGHPCARGASIQVAALKQALKLMQDGAGDALVTLPVHKEQLRRGGLNHAGHTEFFRHCYPRHEVTMCFHASEPINRWVALATDHIPLHKVPQSITTQRMMHCVEALHQASGLPVAVCGLNPHAGEGGMLGSEELGWAKSLNDLAQRGIPCRGFLPADGLFARWRGEEAILALYHDQGLAPFKALTANKACQISLGLPFIRTSPDHGTAYDLELNQKGDPGSTQVAFRTALKLAQR
jgi:4-hydroxythreonine-4-phosphate dehydrogenase